MARRFSSGLASLLLGAVLAALLAPVGVSAQELGEDADQDAGAEQPSGEVGEQPVPPADEDATADAFRVTGERLPVPRDAVQDGEQGLIMWPEGRRAYQLIEGAAGGLFNGAGLAAYDLDSLDEVDRGTIAESGFVFYGHASNQSTTGLMPVDARNGRLFIPYTDAAEGVSPDRPGEASTSGTECRGVLDDPCLRGIYVVDAQTLERTADLRFRPIGIDGLTARPALLAMSHWDRADGSGGLLLLVQAQYDPGFSDANAAGNRRSIQYAMQLDPADGSVDWITQVDGCLSDEQPAGSTTSGAARNAIFGTELESREPEVYVGCYAPGGVGTVVRLGFGPQRAGAGPDSQTAFRGPLPVLGMMADPAAGRMVMRAAPGGKGDSLLVFDARRSSFIGALGVGATAKDGTVTGLDPTAGRLYAITTFSRPEGGAAESLFLAGTTRGETLPQLARVARVEDVVASHHQESTKKIAPLVVDPAADGRPTRVLMRPGDPGATAPDFYYVVEDHRSDEEVTGGALIRDVPYTDDVPQVDGATEAVFTGAARGYGLRALLLGGLDGVVSQSNARGYLAGILNQEDQGYLIDDLIRSQVEPLAPGSYPEEGVFTGTLSPPGNACQARDRELAFGLSGALDVLPDLGPSGAAAQAAGSAVDAQTASDLATPSRCSEGAARMLAAVLEDAGIRPPGRVDDLSLSPAVATASCVAPGEQTSDEQGSQITPASTSYASVDCEEGRRTAGTGRTRLVEVGPVTVGEASSTFEILREPGGGLVAKVRSVARDIDIAGVVHIDAVESTAVSWATGRSQPQQTTDDDYNCTEDRTAGTCVKRTLRGVTAGDFRCDECLASNEEMAAGLQRALGNGWRVTLGEPDPFLARGSDNGALAGVLKSPDRRFSDSTLNADTLPTLPALELVRFNDDTSGRARQVYQFAGIETSTSFGILCLLEVIDGRCTQRPGALSIELLDVEGLPLPGGVFELYRDVAAATGSGEPAGSQSEPSPGASPSAGASPSPSTSPAPTGTPSPDPTQSPSAQPSPGPTAGGPGDETAEASTGSLIDPLVHELVDGGICTTGADGIGACRFEGLVPGDYVIRQMAAPDGFLPAGDLEITIGSGQDLTATFTNISWVGRVDITLTDTAGTPLAGGEFRLSPTDGASEPSGSCVTASDGACSITVALPDGPTDLILSQTSAPDGLAPAPDTPLTLAPGETFTFTFTNVPPARGTIRIGLVDDATDAPLAGGRFAVHADEGDGTVGDADPMVAACATGGDGACIFEAAALDAATLGREGPLTTAGADLVVPLGAYVVRQTTAPTGYQAADDLAFTFDAAGQVAAITFRNGRAGSSGQVGLGGTSGLSPVPSASGPHPLDVPAPQVAPTNAGVGGPTVQQVLQIPAELARLIVRDPLQALAFIAAWALFAAAAAAIHRRLLLADVLGA